MPTNENSIEFEPETVPIVASKKKGKKDKKKKNVLWDDEDQSSPSTPNTEEDPRPATQLSAEDNVFKTIHNAS